MNINWNRIFSNAAVAFFTVLAALSIAQVSTPSALYAGSVGAIIQAGLAAAKDYNDQAEGKDVKGQLGFLVI